MRDQPEGRRPYRGRRPSAARVRFLELIQLGMTASQAAREAGCNVRTGRDWANGIVKTGQGRFTFDGALVWAASSRPRPAREEQLISARFLSAGERIQIADLARLGLPVRAVARRLGRAPSTISRELQRNAHPGSGGYRPWAAQRRAAARRARPKPGKLAGNPALRQAVAAGLGRRWSPEQISRRLRQQFPDRPEMHVAHETIYQALYVQGRGELRRELARCLRTGRAARKPQRRADQRRPRFQAPMLMISDRPAEVADRAVPGHWEGDLMSARTASPRSRPWSSGPPATSCWPTCPVGTLPSRSATPWSR
jgi:IS30 family transposase